MTPELTQLLDHMEWADALIWSEVLDLEAARDDERVRNLLYHVHTVQRVYLQIWRGEPIEAPEPDGFSDLAAIRDWGRAYYERLPDFVATVDADVLDEPIRIPWAAQVAEEFGEANPTSLRQSILQVALHSTYHRGQANTRVRELGGEPPLTDFIAWVWLGRPEAEW